MDKYKRIPITCAKEIAKKYNKQEIVIMARDYNHELVHITTYGVNKKACRQSAENGRQIKKFFSLK